MKNFKVQVDNHQAEFFKQLMDRFDFVTYEEVDGFHEPRVYPAADFEIRSEKDRAAQAKEGMGKVRTKVSTDSEEKRKMDAMSDIRDVISQIDRMRSR
ncbi:hypothetical protein E9993_22170 [Labilibacter sediminis]|nr:hypothetical protein E9993_22170 [Labilibacter sediminis]